MKNLLDQKCKVDMGKLTALPNFETLTFVQNKVELGRKNRRTCFLRKANSLIFACKSLSSLPPWSYLRKMVSYFQKAVFMKEIYNYVYTFGSKYFSDRFLLPLDDDNYKRKMYSHEFPLT